MKKLLKRLFKISSPFSFDIKEPEDLKMSIQLLCHLEAIKESFRVSSDGDEKEQLREKYVEYRVLLDLEYEKLRKKYIPQGHYCLKGREATVSYLDTFTNRLFVKDRY